MSDRDYLLGAFRQMVVSDVQGGSATYAGATLDCAVGVFDLENPLLAAGGGHSPRLVGLIEVAVEDLPTTPTLATGQLMDVADSAGTLRRCKIESWRPVGPLWQITVVAVNQNA